MTILTITGSDSTGGSGVQADIRTITAMGARAASAITSVTLQTTLGIQEFFDLPDDVVEGQIEAVLDDVKPQVVKVGMLRSVGLVRVVARLLRRYKPRFVVYDPVVRSARGDELMPAKVLATVQTDLLPLCTYVVGREEQQAHGHANLFASAVCVYLSRGESLDDAVEHAREYVRSQPQEEPSDRVGELYKEFTACVERFYRTYNDVAFYAEQLGVGSRYLAQVTRRQAGKSPKQLIEERLLSELMMLMDSTAKPLRQIAAELGFSSQSHMTRFFKKLKGLTPTEYRKK